LGRKLGHCKIQITGAMRASRSGDEAPFTGFDEAPAPQSLRIPANHLARRPTILAM
jgi:hypothetical protein